MPLKQHSKEFAKSDLRAVSVADRDVFATVEDNIYAAAADAARNPATVPAGHLRAISETRGGHTYTRYYGQPKASLSDFMPSGRRVKRINEISEGGRKVLYER